MASAFIELSTFAPEKEASDRYMETARRQLLALGSDKYLAEPGTNGYFILKHSVGNIPGNGEIDVALSYADYYFLEALVRYSKISGLKRSAGISCSTCQEGLCRMPICTPPAASEYSPVWDARAIADGGSH